jgi:hypothetical protein
VQNSVKKLWDDEPTPNVDRSIGDVTGFGDMVVPAEIASQEEKRRRAAERILEDLISSQSHDSIEHEVAAIMAAEAHLAAAREEDNEIQNLQ